MFSNMANVNPTILVMAILRVLSGGIEIAAGIMFLKLNRIDRALRINSLLGLVGPVAFLLVSALGIIGLSTRVSFGRMMLILLGILLVLCGTSGS